MRLKLKPGLKLRHPVTKELHDDTHVFDVPPGDPLELFFTKIKNEGDLEEVTAEGADAVTV